MTDADTPRVPEFRWAPVPQWLGAVYVQSRERWYELAVKPDPVDLPADAVKLEDVADLDRLRRDLTATLGLLDVERETLEAAESELADLRQHARNVAAQRDAELAAHKRVAAELDALRADIRAVLATKQPYIGWHREQVLARLDREPGREEPNSQRTPSSPQAGSSAPRTLHVPELEPLSWNARQLVRSACESAITAPTANGWVCAARDTAVVLRTLGMVLGPYHEGLATQCEALADECGHVVEHQPEGDR